MTTCEKVALPDPMTPTETCARLAVVGPRGTIRLARKCRTVYVMEADEQPKLSSQERRRLHLQRRCSTRFGCQHVQRQRRAPASRHGILTMTIRDALRKM